MTARTPRRPRPRPGRATGPAGTTAVGSLALLVVLAGCTTADAAPDDTASATTAEVPGLPVTLTVPAGWVDLSRDGAFVVAAPDEGSAVVRSNVVVTGELSAESIEDAATDTTRYAEGLDGWQPGSGAPEPVTVAGAPAVRVDGTYDADGTLVAQEIVVLETGTGSDRWVVRFTTTAAADDLDAATQVGDVLESVALTPGR
ncbi:LpqN/LpqT family lipoprotein [Cellulosimicrobium terreum]|nr:LpqN/LpqT family lipoprotein [Cellulosimicrobium terreum]